LCKSPAVSAIRPIFIRPCRPAFAARLPRGSVWSFEPKLDGWRWIAIKNGRDLRLYSKGGVDFSTRLPGMVEALKRLPAETVVLDGELTLINPDGTANFYELMLQMRTRRPDESRLRYYVFDLLFADDVDLRSLPLSERKSDLVKLCRKSKVPCMHLVHGYPDGDELLSHAIKLNFEGVVAKRLDRPYISGPCKSWQKILSPAWQRANVHRYKLFEGSKKPALTEDQKILIRKREELRRVRERLHDPYLRPGISRELRKHVAVLEQEIAKLEGG
jgi:bifunctional non-homologous end joining protein LigD